ncbi:MAG: M13 family metallopeptidase [Chlorobi bacterium]|nr:M13 family metallopeptidase [Chlorobiota bacterium]
MKRNTVLPLIVLMLGLRLTGCQSGKINREKPASMNKQEVYHAIPLQYMDTTIRPQDDFYMYVNGTWQRTAQMPPDRSRWGAFSELRKRTDSALLDLVKTLSVKNNYRSGSDQKKALDYYASIMDTATRSRLGIRPLVPFLQAVDSVNSPESLRKYLVRTEPYFESAFLTLYAAPHMKQSNINVLYLSSGTFGLPGRDYYLSGDEDARRRRNQYRQHIERMWQFLPGRPDGKKAAENVMKIETRLARAVLNKVERRQPENRYNPRKMADLYKEAPSFDWRAYADELGLHSDSLILSQPRYLPAFEQILKEGDWEAVRDYLRWTLLRSSAGRLSEEISHANWEFYGKTLRGTPRRMPLEERALNTVNRGIGEALGKVYVDRYFTPEAKQKAKELVGYLQKAYKERIDRLDWMSAETKEKAKEKVDKLLVKIGYPDKWKDYSTMKIKSPAEGGNYFDNALAVHRWHYDDMRRRLHRPVDRSEWGMTPQTVNAYYNPLNNEIVFPAAILQAPFFDPHADAAVNFGGIGAVIGHEISHGFDDQGAKFDANGNFRMWWKPEDFENFQKRGEKLAEQYSAIEVLPGLYINGKFTLGENIGDLGGVFAAYTALNKYWNDHGKPGKIDGFTPEQRYFMSWAVVWRTKMRKDALIKQIKTDPHSPGRVRAYQPLRNMEAFHRAFTIRPGDSMYLAPRQRVKIW